MRKVKNIGKWMIALGIILIIVGISLIMQSKADKQVNKKDTDQYTSTTQTQQDRTHTQAQYSSGDATQQVTEQVQNQDASNKTDKNDKTDEVPKDKWPYGNERYIDYDEPMRVREFHNNKEYYDAVVEQFTPYEGMDISFYTHKMFPIKMNNPNKEDGTVEVTSYNVDTFKALMKYTRVDAIDANGRFCRFLFCNT